MQSIERKNAGGTNDHKSEWVYDGLSRKKVLREFSWVNNAWRLDSAKSYIYDGMDVVQERESLYAADGVTVASSTQVNFTRTGNIGGILARTNQSNQHVFFHYDGSGNVVSLTDGSQNSVAEYSYDSYGNALTATGTQASSNAYRYSTKELHSWTGFYDYGYRFYSPGLGRWINRDPIGEAGGLNLYALVGNNPINLVDPRGLRAQHWANMTPAQRQRASQYAAERAAWRQGFSSSVGDSLSSMKEGAIAATTFNTSRGARAYDYGPLGQADRSDPTTRRNTRAAVGVATVAAGAAAAIMAWSCPAVVNAGRAAGGMSRRGGAAVGKGTKTALRRGAKASPKIALGVVAGAAGNVAATYATGDINSWHDFRVAAVSGGLQGAFTGGIGGLSGAKDGLIVGFSIGGGLFQGAYAGSAR